MGCSASSQKVASSKKDEFEEKYECDHSQQLGRGAFSVVRLCHERATGKAWAVKIIEKESLNADDLEDIEAEIGILSTINHANIMNLQDTIITDARFYLVSEYIEGGELFDRIVGKVCYTEKEARDTIKLLLSAIAYCHSQNIVHRDLKPENLLLTSELDDSDIKVADFGLARKIADGSPLDTVCGTPTYVAPEILEMEGYGLGVDIWSIGIVTFILLCGYPPFRSDDSNLSVLFEQIKHAEYEFRSPFWDPISLEARAFVQRMLIKDPKKRATAAELLEDPWIVGSDISTVPLDAAHAGIAAFNSRKKWRAAIRTVRVSVRLNKMSRAAADAKKEEDAEAAGADQADEYWSRVKGGDAWLEADAGTSKPPPTLEALKA
jgi:calcium/calmodulin-dependent protein kinase I